MRKQANTELAPMQLLQNEKTTLQGGSAKFRKASEGTIKLVISAKDAISTAISFNPCSSCMDRYNPYLPLFLVRTQEIEVALEGLNFAAVLLREYRWKEKSYLSSDYSGDF